MTSDLASLLSSGERAVFHGAPGSAVADLERAVALANDQERHAEAAAATWLLGVALSAVGRYGGTLRLLLPLVSAGEVAQPTAETRLFAALAAATAASVHRGLGRHDDAQTLDRRGLTLTDGSGEAAYDCTLGLVSDAIGAADVAEAGQQLGVVESMLAGRGEEWWRQRIRFGWAAAELALLQEQADEAVRRAADSVALAEQARAPRHVAKGLLFQGVAELQTGSPDAQATLRRAASLAAGLGTLPLVWQARALLGALGDDELGSTSLAAARSAVLTIAADLPPDLRDHWLARPTVEALLDA